jgi:hypothetical protein
MALEGGCLWPARRHALEPLACGGDVVRPDTAAASDDLRPFGAPGGGEVRVLLRAGAGVEGPARLREVAEVRIDAEREVGEVAQPREDPRHVVRRDAVDEQGRDAHRLETPGHPSEEVALGPAPVLPEHAADPVQAAAKAQPDRDARLEHGLDGRDGDLLADERHRLQEDEVRRVLGEDALQEPQALELVRVVDVPVQAEGEGALARAPGLRDRLAADANAAPGELEPVRGGHVRPGRGLVVHGREDAPGVRRDDVAADLGVPAVDVEDGLGGVVERPGSPGAVVAEGAGGRVEPRELGRRAAVEDDAALAGEQLLDAQVGRPRRGSPPVVRGSRRGCHSRSGRRSSPRPSGLEDPLRVARPVW